MIDKSTTLQIFGSLLKHPQFLSQTDRYNLTPEDFHFRLDKFIFVAIDSLYRDGATHINPIDVENYLSSNEQASILFRTQNGIEYLQDADYLADEESFPYYYKKLKKFNLLEVLKGKGIDTSQYFVEEPLTDKELEINAKFEDLEINDILAAIKTSLVTVERKFIENDTTQTQMAFTGIEEIIEGADRQDDIGKPVQGDIFNEVMSGARRGTLVVRSLASGAGKAIPNSTKIPTPDGWKEVGEIKVGDYLFDAFGKPTQVIGVFPQGLKRVYEVNFKDGRKARCCKEHLWSFNTKGQKNKSKQERKFITEELQDIMKRPLRSGGGYNILVPMSQPVEYPEKEYFIPPYVFGLILGDGSFRQQPSNKSFQYSSEDKELPEIIAKEMGWTLKEGSSKNFSWYFSFKEKQNEDARKNVWVEDVLKEYKDLIDTYSYEKYIPSEYLYGSIEQRYELLNGLLDSDGSIDEKGRVSFTNSSLELIKNVKELTNSLGFQNGLVIDEREGRRTCYQLNIQGSKEQKKKLFKLKRKVEIRDSYINNGKRSDLNAYNPITEIKELDTYEEMTCFTVDNEERLFLMNDFIVTHNTRSSVGDACYLAFPLRYSTEKGKWEQVGSNEKVLVVVTEQSIKEIQRMILAYITGFNETRFRFGDFSEKEKDIIAQALWVMKTYQENFYIVQMPNPTIELIKTIVRENVLLHDIGYVFYDYIFIGPAVLSEFAGFKLRNDEILLMMATALKDLAVELNVFVMTSTQVNAKADNNEDIRNESSIAGSRAIINKADIGVIAARPSKEELDFFSNGEDVVDVPTLVTDVYKVRSGQWTQVRIWSDANLGNLRKKDLFVTDNRMEIIPNVGYPFNLVEDWESEQALIYREQLKELENIKFEKKN